MLLSESNPRNLAMVNPSKVVTRICRTPAILAVFPIFFSSVTSSSKPTINNKSVTPISDKPLRESPSESLERPSGPSIRPVSIYARILGCLKKLTITAIAPARISASVISKKIDCTKIVIFCFSRYLYFSD